MKDGFYEATGVDYFVSIGGYYRWWHEGEMFGANHRHISRRNPRVLPLQYLQ